MDGVPAPMDVLQSIVQETSGEIEVFLDGGVRTGLDVFKALAYGEDHTYDNITKKPIYLFERIKVLDGNITSQNYP